MSNVVEFARAARLLKLKKGERYFFRLAIDPKKGCAVLTGDAIRGSHDLGLPALRRFEEFFRSWAHVFMTRDEEQKRANNGNCALRFCDRKNWRATGLCRSCAELMIGRAKGSR